MEEQTEAAGSGNAALAAIFHPDTLAREFTNFQVRPGLFHPYFRPH
jgi:hypothetical protein